MPRPRTQPFLVLCYAALLAAPFSAVANSIPRAPVVVTNLRETQAFRSTLAGTPDLYTFTLPAQQTVFAGLYILDNGKSRKDTMVEITSERGARYAVDGTYFNAWKTFNLPDGETYLKGPEIAPQLYAGTYTLTVSNLGNGGAYMVVLGDHPDIPANGAAQAHVARAWMLAHRWLFISIALIPLAYAALLYSFDKLRK